MNEQHVVYFSNLFQGFPNPIVKRGRWVSNLWIARGGGSTASPPEGLLRSFGEKLNTGSGPTLLDWLVQWKLWNPVLLLSTVQYDWWNMKKPVQKFFSDSGRPSDIGKSGATWENTVALGLSSSSSHILVGSMTIIQGKRFVVSQSLCPLRGAFQPVRPSFCNEANHRATNGSRAASFRELPWGAAARPRFSDRHVAM